MSLTDLASWAREYHHDVARYLLQVQESDLDERIAMPGVGKQSQQPSLWETLLQITAHSTYHRGQVGSRLREIGGEPPQTDFINWVILGKPNAEWPSETEVEEAAEG